MSGSVNDALGIEASKPQSVEAAAVRPVLYRVKRQDGISGPYTLNQMRSMWAAGSITADMEFADTNTSDWRPMVQAIELLEGQSGVDSAVASVVLQARLKSPTVAVLLGLFLPFVGAFYGSVAAALVPFFVGIAAGFGGFIVALIAARPSDAEALVIWGAITSLFAIWSLFWSLAAVKKHNVAVIAEVQL